MSSLSCCIDFHDDLMYGLDFIDRLELFGVKKSQFKKVNVVEVSKNKSHMKKLMTKYEEDAKSVLAGEKLVATYSIST